MYEFIRLLLFSPEIRSGTCEDMMRCCLVGDNGKESPRRGPISGLRKCSRITINPKASIGFVVII